MNITGKQIALILVALILSNFFYQFLNFHRWDEAIDRSFFQAVALSFVYMAAKLGIGK